MRLAYRQVTITDFRGRILGYADSAELQPAESGKGTFGVTGGTFAPRFVRTLGSPRRVDLLIESQGIPRLRLRGVRLMIFSGEVLVTTGEYACLAAIGVFRSCQLLSRPRGGKTGTVPE